MNDDYSCFRAEYECFQIELAKNYGVPEWREDLKKVLLKSGVENKSMVFLFSDTQVILRRVYAGKQGDKCLQKLWNATSGVCLQWPALWMAKQRRAP